MRHHVTEEGVDIGSKLLENLLFKCEGVKLHNGCRQDVLPGKGTGLGAWEGRFLGVLTAYIKESEFIYSPHQLIVKVLIQYGLLL